MHITLTLATEGARTLCRYALDCTDGGFDPVAVEAPGEPEIDLTVPGALDAHAARYGLSERALRVALTAACDDVAGH